MLDFNGEKNQTYFSILVPSVDNQPLYGLNLSIDSYLIWTKYYEYWKVRFINVSENIFLGFQNFFLCEVSIYVKILDL